MNAGQYEGIMARLAEIRDRLPSKVDDAPEIVVEPPAEYDLHRLTTPTDQRAAAMALTAVLVMLDFYILAVRENHQALDHRYEPVGDECWRSYHPVDIRQMVMDAARSLGLEEFQLLADPAEGRSA